jgi:hypothetical protein
MEQGCNRSKRGGWHWQYTRLTAPARAERLWVAIASATWWWLAVGGAAEAKSVATPLLSIPGSPRRQGRRWRLLGICRQGWALIMAALFTHQPLPLGHGHPEPWLAVPIPSDSPPLAEPAGGI